MSSAEFVDLATARTARGVRIVAPGFVPSPWSEAAKGLFRLQGVPVLVVRSSRDPELVAWAQASNVPSVLFDDEPPRTVWSQLLTLAARLGPPGALLPLDLARRAEIVGLIHELAGEDGLGWNARLLMIHASLTSNGARGFSLKVASFLAARYGYAASGLDAARAQIRATCTELAHRLGDRDYLTGDRPGALDVYAATFLTPLHPIPEADCPALTPALRSAFATAYEDLGAEVPAELTAHRRRMFERHLAWPIQI